MKLEHVQIELNGTCESKCPICLPDPRKTGREMSREDIDLVVDQLHETDVSTVVLAGFGDPWGAQELYYAIERLRAIGVVVCGTCPPQKMHNLVHAVDQLNVSVRSVADAKRLIEEVTDSRRPIDNTKIVPHMVLTDDVAGLMDVLIAVLGAWIEKWWNISIATPVKLCDDPGHVECIRHETARLKENWGYTRKVLDRYGLWGSPRVQVFDDSARMGKCVWPWRGLFIKANLDVQPCCYLPCVEPIANLRHTTLRVIADGDPHRNYSEYCARCPDTGGNSYRQQPACVTCRHCADVADMSDSTDLRCEITRDRVLPEGICDKYEKGYGRADDD